MQILIFYNTYPSLLFHILKLYGYFFSLGERRLLDCPSNILCLLCLPCQHFNIYTLETTCKLFLFLYFNSFHHIFSNFNLFSTQKILITASSSWASLEQWQEIWTQQWGKSIPALSYHMCKLFSLRQKDKILYVLTIQFSNQLMICNFF